MYTLRISEADPYLAETVGVENKWMSCTACSQWGSGGCKDSVSGCSAEAQIAYRSQTEGLENIWDEKEGVLVRLPIRMHFQGAAFWEELTQWGFE